jgi:hypothetical protein
MSIAVLADAGCPDEALRNIVGLVRRFVGQVDMMKEVNFSNVAEEVKRDIPDKDRPAQLTAEK